MVKQEHICIRNTEIAEIKATQRNRNDNINRIEKKIDEMFKKVDNLDDKLYSRMSILLKDIKMEINKDLEDYVKKSVFNELGGKVNNISDRIQNLESIMSKLGWWFFGTMFVIVTTLTITIAILLKTIY